MSATKQGSDLDAFFCRFCCVFALRCTSLSCYVFQGGVISGHGDKATLSDPDLSCPDELGDVRMRVLKLRSSSTTSTQQRSTICSHRPCNLDFCAPRRRHARRRARPRLPWPTLKITNAERNESSKSSTITRAPPPSSKLTPRWCASHPRCLN